MRAVRFHQFGDPAEVLSVEDVQTPEPGQGEVLVRMLASPINPSDLMTVEGVYGVRPDLPATPGYEGVGIVEESNGLLGRLFKGKRVAVLNRAGGNWAERVVVPAKQVIPLPADMSLARAAMFFVNPATAYVMTTEVLGVGEGEWLLQTAAGSSLGRMVVRLGKELGFKTINVVRRADEAEELRKHLGGDAWVVFDGEKQRPEQLASEVEQKIGGGVQYAIDPVGGATLSGVIRALGVGGRVLSYGTLAREEATFSPRQLLERTAKIEGFWLSRHMAALGLLKKLKLVGTLKKLIDKGVLAAETENTFPLEQVTAAVQKSREVGRGGKAILTMDEE